MKNLVVYLEQLNNWDSETGGAKPSNWKLLLDELQAVIPDVVHHPSKTFTLKVKHIDGIFYELHYSNCDMRYATVIIDYLFEIIGARFYSVNDLRDGLGTILQELGYSEWTSQYKSIVQALTHNGAVYDSIEKFLELAEKRLALREAHEIGVASMSPFNYKPDLDQCEKEIIELSLNLPHDIAVSKVSLEYGGFVKFNGEICYINKAGVARQMNIIGKSISDIVLPFHHAKRIFGYE